MLRKQKLKPSDTAWALHASLGPWGSQSTKRQLLTFLSQFLMFGQDLPYWPFLEANLKSFLFSFFLLLLFVLFSVPV